MLKADLRINLHNQSVLPISYYTFVYIRYTNQQLASSTIYPYDNLCSTLFKSRLHLAI